MRRHFVGRQSTSATRFIAFLRAINVGGHTVKMDHLRRLFEALGFENVATFIASGNVIFDAPAMEARALERQIEGHLRQSLGYEVATFVRSMPELAAVASHRPFGKTLPEGSSLYIAFLRKAPEPAAARKILAFATKIDEFHIRDREVYWLCRKRMMDSTFSGAVLEKTLGMAATLRNATTVSKIAGKHA